MVTEKFATYFTLLMVTSITSSVHNSHSDSDVVLKLLFGLLEWVWSFVFSASDFVHLMEWVSQLLH